MEGFSRYAIYWTPEEGPLAQFGRGWLGWDAEAAEPVPHPAVAGLPRDLASSPRRRGNTGCTAR